MNSKKLFVNIAQVVALDADQFAIPTIGEYSRDVVTHIARNTNSGNVSHITVEFKGTRSKFLCVAMFDGFGDYGATINGFVMPRMKLTLDQRVLIAMSVFEYLCNGKFHLNAEFTDYKDKFISEIKGGVNNLAEMYERISALSDEILSQNETMTGQYQQAHA